jgi:hypothetical protein
MSLIVTIISKLMVAAGKSRCPVFGGELYAKRDNSLSPTKGEDNPKAKTTLQLILQALRLKYHSVSSALNILLS